MPIGERVQVLHNGNTGETRPAVVLSEVSPGITLPIPIGGPNPGEGFVQVKEQQPSGAWTQVGVHISRLIRGE